MTDTPTIPGYTYGSADAAHSPVSEEDFARLLATVLWTDDDEQAIRRAGDVLSSKTDQVLDVWYGFVAAHPHLVAYFADAAGNPDGDYLARVRARFDQWIRDLCDRSRDRSWLDYQEEIALRHTAAGKNVTDGAHAPAEIPLRYMIAFVYPITATIREFLAADGHADDDVEAMYQAWFKSVVLSVTLWARPYAPERW